VGPEIDDPYNYGAMTGRLLTEADLASFRANLVLKDYGLVVAHRRGDNPRSIIFRFAIRRSNLGLTTERYIHWNAAPRPTQWYELLASGHTDGDLALIRETVHSLLSQIWTLTRTEWLNTHGYWMLHRVGTYRVIYTGTRDLAVESPTDARTEFREQRGETSASIMTSYPKLWDMAQLLAAQYRARWRALFPEAEAQWVDN